MGNCYNRLIFTLLILVYFYEVIFMFWFKKFAFFGMGSMYIAEADQEQLSLRGTFASDFWVQRLHITYTTMLKYFTVL